MSNLNPLNFLPEEYVASQGRRSKRLAIALVSIFVASIAIAAFWMVRGNFAHLAHFGSRMPGSPTVESRSMPAAPMAAPPVVASVQSGASVGTVTPATAVANTTMDPTAANVSMELDRLPIANLMREVAGALPAGVTLEDMSLVSKPLPRLSPTELKSAAAGSGPSSTSQPASAAPETAALHRVASADLTTGAGAYSVTLQIDGTAQSGMQVEQFINRLGKPALLRNLMLLTSEQSAPADGKPCHYHLEFGMDRTSAHPDQATAATDMAK